MADELWKVILKYLVGLNPFYPKIAVLVLVIGYILSIFWGLYRGHEVDFLWGMAKFRPSGAVRDLKNAIYKIQAEYRTIQTFAEQKSSVIKLLGNINNEIERLANPSLGSEEFERLFEKVLDYVLPAVTSIITEDKGNDLRVAILVPEGEILKIFSGYGYSTQERDDVKLRIEDSFAGDVYIKWNSKYSGDVQKDSSWKPMTALSKDYNSLFCYPIGTHKKWGILNIDGVKADCFSQDDRHCIRYIAQALSIIFEIRDLVKNRGTITIKGGGEHEGEGKREKRSRDVS